jgi:hypothetical protein
MKTKLSRLAAAPPIKINNNNQLQVNQIKEGFEEKGTLAKIGII